MAHRYESIKELDEEMNGEKRKMEMSIEKYMEPQPFRKLGPWGEEEIEGTTIGYVCNEREACSSKRGKRWKAVPDIKRWKAVPDMLIPPSWELDASIEEYEKREKEERLGGCVKWRPTNLANRSNRVRVKNVHTGVLFEFTIISNSARFMGATHNNMRYGILDKVARVFRVGQDKFVFEYDGVERPSGYDVEEKVLDGFVEVVWGLEDRERFDSYLLVAIHLGLLIGHIMEEEGRWRDGKLAKTYVIGKKHCTLEFNGERRQRDCGNGIVSHWMGLYEGDWEKVRKVVITQGNPQPRM